MAQANAIGPTSIEGSFFLVYYFCSMTVLISVSSPSKLWAKNASQNETKVFPQRLNKSCNY